MTLKVMDLIHNNKNWKEVLGESPYYIFIKENNDYYLLKYNQLKSDMLNDIVKECRGLIIRKEDMIPIALSFIRFETDHITYPMVDIDWNNAVALEKIDGARIMLWNDNNEWHISTSGNINAYDSPIITSENLSFGSVFKRVLDKYAELEELNPNWIYTFELLTPEEQHIIPNDKEDIYLIGLRDKDTFDEIDIYSVKTPFNRPKRYEITSLDNTRDICKGLNKNGIEHEGFVVIDKNFNRLKVKTDEYYALRRMKVSADSIKEEILNAIENNTIENYLTQFPLYRSRAEEIKESIQDWFMDSIHAVEQVIVRKYQIDHELKITSKEDYETKKKEERKQLAQFILSEYKDFSSLLFKYLDELVPYAEKRDIYNQFDFVSSYWDKLSLENKLKAINNY